MFRGFSLLLLLCTISHLPEAKNPPTNIDVHLQQMFLYTTEYIVFIDFEDFRENIKDSGKNVQIVKKEKANIFPDRDIIVEFSTKLGNMINVFINAANLYFANAYI
jgi:hypothetical protein